MNPTLSNALSLGGTLWGLAFGIYTVLQLPERVPVHFGLNNQPDRYGTRLEAGFGVIVLVLIAVFVNLVFVTLTRGDARAKAQEPTLNLLRVSVTLLMLVLQFVIAQSFHSQLFDGRIVMIGLGALLVILGNFMPKLSPNPYVGVRLPYTYASDRAWRVANRAGGWMFVAIGVAIALLSALLPGKAANYAVIVMPVALILALVWLWQIAKREYETDPERRPLS